jgi:hypothetical protein
VFSVDTVRAAALVAEGTAFRLTEAEAIACVLGTAA